MSTAARESAAGVTQVSDTARDLEVVTGRLRGGVEEFDLGSETDDETVSRSPVESPELAPGGDGHQAPQPA
jgi:methyl-accepting chemotaxis protein